MMVKRRIFPAQCVRRWQRPESSRRRLGVNLEGRNSERIGLREEEKSREDFRIELEIEQHHHDRVSATR